MLSYYTADAIAAAPTDASLDPALRQLLALGRTYAAR